MKPQGPRSGLFSITRRQFSFASLAAAGTGRRLAADDRLDIGVGTFSYHSLSIPEMIKRLQALKITEIEMSRGEFMLMNPPTEAMCRNARSLLDAAGIRCSSYYTATIKTQQDLGYAVRNAKLLGARNVSGDAVGPILHDIDRRFSAENLTFGIHNHWFAQGFPYQSAEDVLRALGGLSHTVGSTLDVGQMAACGHDPVEAVHLLAPHLKVVHLKDVEAAGAEHNVLLGRGVANISGVMRALKQIGFRGLVAIEYEKEGDVDADMEAEVKYARERA